MTLAEQRLRYSNIKYERSLIWKKFQWDFVLPGSENKTKINNQTKPKQNEEKHINKGLFGITVVH